MLKNNVPEHTSETVNPSPDVISFGDTPSVATTSQRINAGASGGVNDFAPEPMASPLPRLAYTMAETATILGVSYITIHRWIKRGLLRCLSASRHKVIPKIEIERFLKCGLK